MAFLAETEYLGRTPEFGDYWTSVFGDSGIPKPEYQMSAVYAGFHLKRPARQVSESLRSGNPLNVLRQSQAERPPERPADKYTEKQPDRQSERPSSGPVRLNIPVQSIAPAKSLNTSPVPQTPTLRYVPQASQVTQPLVVIQAPSKVIKLDQPLLPRKPETPKVVTESAVKEMIQEAEKVVVEESSELESEPDTPKEKRLEYLRQVLKTKRIKDKISQGELGHLLGITQASYSSLERKCPKIERLIQAIRLLDPTYIDDSEEVLKNMPQEI